MNDLGAMPPGVALRPLGTAEVLDSAVRLVRRNARAAFALSAPFAVLRAAFGAVLDLAGGSSTGAGGLTLGGGLLIAGTFGTILTGLLTPVFAGDVLGERIDAREALRRVGHRWWPLVVLAVVASLAEDTGLVLLVAGGVWLWGSWAVAAPAMIVEGTGVRRGLRRSVELTRTNFWRTWGLRALGWVLTYVLGLFVQLPFLVAASALTDVNPFDAGHVVTTTGLFVVLTALGTLLAVTITAPITSAVEVLLYVDLRMRREGLDILVALPPRPVPAPTAVW